MNGPLLDAPLCEERVAHNEVVSRRVNEAVEEAFVNRDGATGYERARSAPHRFLLHAGHETRFDRVVHRADNHVVDEHSVGGRKRPAGRALMPA